LVKTLVVGQIALSSVLLVGAGLLVQSMRHILNADLGLDRDRVLVVDVASSRLGYSGARLSSLMNDLADRTRRMPGVTAASYSFEGVFSGGYSSGHATVPGYVAATDSLREVGYDEVGPDYFRSIGAHIIRGRDFEPRDLVGGNKLAAINETMAKAYFAGVDPIGRTLEMDSVIYSVAAIVRDIEERNVRAKPLRHLYIPIDPPKDPQSFVLLAHVDGDPSLLAAPIRTALAEIDPKLRSEAAPLERLVRASVADDGLVARVTSFFGIVTLVLAGLGLYGVIAYATSQRTSELGLRLALGAEPSRVAGMVVGDALKLAAIGIAIGLPSGLLAARLIRGQIFGVGQVDPPSLIVVIALLSTVVLVASYAPARRAARVGPLEALRAD
jgi:predicted permease